MYPVTPLAAKRRVSKEIPNEFKPSESNPVVEDGVALNHELLQKASFVQLVTKKQYQYPGTHKKGECRMAYMYDKHPSPRMSKPQTPSDGYKPRAAAKAMGSLAGRAFHAMYRTKHYTTKGLKWYDDGKEETDLVINQSRSPSKEGNQKGDKEADNEGDGLSDVSSVRDDDGCDDVSSVRPPTAGSEQGATPPSCGRGRSMPAPVKLPELPSITKEFVKHIHGHYCVPAPKSQWLSLLTFLFDETLLHPHALVYCDESVASKRGFKNTMDRHNLVVTDYGSDNPFPKDDDGAEEISQFLVTNPKFSNFSSMGSSRSTKPSISCIFHMDGVKSPWAYGAHLGPVDEEVGWDAISVLFIEPYDFHTKTEIEKTYGIEFKEVPFDLPEISMHADNKEWTSAVKGACRPNRWNTGRKSLTVIRGRGSLPRVQTL